MAHPDLMLFTHLPDAVEQRRMFDHPDKGAAELAMIGGRHPTAQLRGHGLLAIADAEHRHARLEHPLRRTRAFLKRDRRRAARKDDALGPQPVERRLGAAEGRDFAIDPGLPHAASDKLRHLARTDENTSALQYLMRLPYAVSS